MTSFSIRLNPMQISQLPAFLNIRGRIHDSCKDVYFLGMAWFCSQSPDTLVKTLSSACARTGNHCIVCIGAHMLRRQSKQHSLHLWRNAYLQAIQTFCFPRSLHSFPPCSFTAPSGKGLNKQTESRIAKNKPHNCSVSGHHSSPFVPVSSDVFPKCIWIGEPDCIRAPCMFCTARFRLRY